MHEHRQGLQPPVRTLGWNWLEHWIEGLATVSLTLPLVLDTSRVHLTDEQFYQLCRTNPDLQIERNAQRSLIVMTPVGGEGGSPEMALRSPTDDLELLQAKMQEYMDAGGRLAWMFNPQDQQVEIYRQGQPKEGRESPTELSGEDVLPGFVLPVGQFESY